MSPFTKDIIVAVFLEKKMVFKTSPVCWPRVDDLLPFSSNFLQSYKPLASTDDGIEGSRENEINQSFHHLIYRKCMHMLFIAHKNLRTVLDLLNYNYSYKHKILKRRLLKKIHIELK